MLTLILSRYVTLGVTEASLHSLTASSVAGKTNSILFSIDQYLNASENNSDQNIYYNIDRTLPVFADHTIEVDMNLNWSQHENYLYLHATDLHYSISNFDIGIKKLSWSSNLDFFHSQEWQQQLERNKLNPKTGGNLGFFYGMQGEGFNVDLMYSPFFLPTRGPDFKFVDGMAYTESPWFLLPPTEVPYDGDTFSTRYELQDIDYAEFLRQQSYAFNVTAFNSKDWTFNIGYANKPSPKLVTDLDFQANVSDPNVPIDVFVKPRVVRHQLISSQLSYNFSTQSRLTFGYLNETFDKDSGSSESETYMQPLDQDVFSLVFNHTNERYSLSLGGIWREGGRSRSVGELASALASQNLNYLYEQAIKLDFTYFQTWGWSLHTSMSYDFFQKGILTTASFQRTINNALLNVGFDALEPINASDESSFIYQYRNLDRVWAGVSYVF